MEDNLCKKKLSNHHYPIGGFKVDFPYDAYKY